MKLKFVSILLASAMLVSACSNSLIESQNPSSSQSQTNTLQSIDTTALNVQVGAEPVSLDPAFAIFPNELSIIKHIFAPLMELGKDGKVSGVLATDYDKKVNDAGNTVYTFTISENAMWSDGTKITADDFAYSFKRVLKPETKSPNAYQLFPIKNAREFNMGSVQEKDLGISTKDNTLIIELNGDTDDFLERLSLPAYLVVNQKAVKDGNRLWSQSIKDFIASGKFKPTKWEKSSSLLLERNEKYINQNNITAQKLNFVFNLSKEDTIKALENNSIVFSDIIYPEIKTKYSASDNKSGKNYKSDAVMGTVLLEYNNSKSSVLSKTSLREALSLAIDRDKLSENMDTTFSTAVSLLPNTTRVEGKEFFTAIYETTKAQTARAKSLLNDTKDLAITFLVDNSTQNVKIANDITKTWTDLGIKVTLLTKPFEEYHKILKSGEYDVTLSTVFNETLNPVEVLSKWLSTSPLNYAKVEDNTYEGLILSALGIKNLSSTQGSQVKPTAPDKSKTKLQLMQEAEKLLLTEKWSVFPLMHYMYSYVASDNLTGYSINHLGEVDFSKAVYIPKK